MSVVNNIFREGENLKAFPSLGVVKQEGFMSCVNVTLKCDPIFLSKCCLSSKKSI